MELVLPVSSHPFGQASLVDVAPFEPGDPLELTLYLSRVPAGFANPADDHVDVRIDLQEHLVRNPASTFVGWIEGDSLVEYGIHDGDLAVVDRSVEPVDGKFVVAALDGEFLVKKLQVTGKNGSERVWLVSGHPSYAPIEVLEGHELVIWGVVTYVIHKCG